MPPPGGSSTINGVLYQILGSLEWATRFTLTPKNQNPMEAITLVIEPSGGGGDTQVHFPKRRVVEQWKSKSDRGSWSLNDVIKDVLPDLYRAIDEKRLTEEVEYRFVTEGHKGRWKAAEEFFRSLASNAVPDDPCEAIDCEERICFLPKEPESRRELFVRIAKIVRGKDELEQIAYRKLWHLLSRFQIVEAMHRTELSRKLNERIGEIVDRIEDADEKRQQLCGLVLEMASKGEVVIAPQELLGRAGLKARSFAAWGLVQRVLLDRLSNHLQRTNYQVQDDVRRSGVWPTEKRIVIYSGESGQGKTWRLASCALAQASNEGLAVWVKASADAERDLTTAADEVWQHGLDHDGSLALHRIARRRKQIKPDINQPWLMICIDDVQTAQEAHALVQQDWNEWQVCLAMSAPPFVAHSLKEAHPDLVHVVDIEDFTLPELQRYLLHRGKDWTTLPNDVRETLRRPLLAKLYSDFAAAEIWEPTSEYELYRRWWQQTIERIQTDHPNDIAMMRALAVTALDKDVRYPWTSETLLNQGIQADTRKRFEEVGFLRRTNSLALEVWHDRLLNWAVAEGLFHKCLSGEYSGEQLYSIISRLSTPFSASPFWRLRYVPADILWLVTRNVFANEQKVEFARMIQAMEGEHPRLVAEAVYREVLPTIGPSIVSALIERVRGSHCEGWNPYPSYVATCFSRLAKTSQESVHNQMLPMLQDPSEEVQDTALLTLLLVPGPAVLDELWILHKRNTLLSERPNLRRERSFEALRSCASADVNWLTKRIREADPQAEPVADLLFILANLPVNEGLHVWQQTKSDLFEKLPMEGRRAVAHCLIRFRDANEVGRLESWLKEESDFLGGLAFSALASIDPDRALARIKDVHLGLLRMMTSSWLPELLVRRSTATKHTIREWMEASTLEVCWNIACLYEGHENEMDATTVELVLANLERTIDAENLNLRNPLRLLSKVGSLAGLERFRACFGMPVEIKLSKLACSWVESLSGDTDILDAAIKVLFRIGGAGFTRLVNSCLRCEDRGVQFTTLRWALIRPDADTIEYLRRYCLEEPAETTRAGTAPRHAWDAISILAELEQNAIVVATILKWGPDVAGDDLVNIRYKKSPMSDAEIAPAVEAVRSSDARARANGARVLGLSGCKEFKGLLLELLDVEVPDSEAAFEMTYALHCLGEKSSEFIRHLKTQLTIPKRLLPVINMLGHVDTPDAWDALEHAYQSGEPRLGSFSQRLGQILMKRGDRRQRLARTFWERARSSNEPWQELDSFYLLADLDDPQIQEFLWSAALTGDGAIHYTGKTEAALRALVKYDPERVFNTAVTELRRGARDRELLVRLLLEIDPLRASECLCEHVGNESNTFVRWEIGRRLRRFGDLDILAGQAKNLLSSPEHLKRRRGTELCGWMGPDFLATDLQNLALNDADPDVRLNARQALQKQRDEAEAKRLYSALESTTPIRQWCYMDSILEIVDPSVLVHSKRPFDFASHAKKLPVPMLRELNHRLNRRREELKKLAEAKDKS